MCRLILVVFSLCAINVLMSQTQIYSFQNTTEYNDFNPYSTMSPVSFSYDLPQQAVNYEVSSTDPLHLLSTQALKSALPFQLGNYFEVSFKAHKNLTSNSNTYFPLLLTQTILTGTNQHPWRLGPNASGTLGNQQSCGLIGVVFTHNTIGVVYRQNGMTNGTVNYISGYTVPVQTDFWVKLTRNCQNELILEVFNVATMDNTPLASQVFNITGPVDNYGALYITNCNGNGQLTEHDDLLDDYRIHMAPPVGSVDIAGPNSMCAGETIQLTASVSSNITWSTGETTQTISVNSAGTYSVTYDTGCGTIVANHLVTENPSPSITSVDVQNVSCAGMQDGQFTVNATGSNLQYSIDGGQSWQSSNTFDSLPGGDYTVTVQTSSGCMSTTTVTIDEGGALAASILTDGPYCQGETGTLFGQSSGTGAIGYSWTGPNGYTSSLQNPNDITESGTYMLIVSAGSCTGTVSIDLVFAENPIAIFSTATVCEGNETVFSSSGSGVEAPDVITDWQWTFGDGMVSQDENPVHEYDQSGTYGATLTVTSSSGCQATFSQGVEVLEAPVASFQFSPVIVSSSDPEVTFTNTSQNADYYLWTFEEGGSNSTEISPTYTYPQTDGSYTVTLIAYNASGCLDSIQKVITIGEGVVYYVPNTFTPNSDGVNDVFLPVFTSGYDENNYEMFIVNRWGELIFSSNSITTGWDGTYLNKKVQDGVYIWVIRFKHSNDDAFEQVQGHVSVFR